MPHNPSALKLIWECFFIVFLVAYGADVRQNTSIRELLIDNNYPKN